LWGSAIVLGKARDWHPVGSLPNDGKVIADERPIG
jgi:hypothetical protein